MQLFISSGDVIADRRYAFGMELQKRGDLPAAADLYAQAVEAAPAFASAWFALGEARVRLGDAAGAAQAFDRARWTDPDDRHGAAVQLARLTGKATAMPAGYVRTLFDQYAKHYDLSLLEGLEYQGPRLLRDAVMGACEKQGREARFRHAIDIGCGTGLAGAAFRPFVESLVGVDLSPAMMEEARKGGHYDGLAVGDALAFLLEQGEGAADLVIAADSFPYLSDIGPLVAAVGRVLTPGGLFAFTVETHDGSGVLLRETLRYAHAADHVATALAGAGLVAVTLAAASSRKEKNIPVPGLTVIGAKPASTPPPSAVSPA